jgi:hypothetical protein
MEHDNECGTILMTVYDNSFFANDRGGSESML